MASYINTLNKKKLSLFYDVIEDSDITAADLFASGLSNEVVTAVQILTKKKGHKVNKNILNK